MLWQSGPTKITDLIAKFTDQNKGTLLLSWTSPGGDLIQGPVSGHVIIFARELKELFDSNYISQGQGEILKIEKRGLVGEKMQQAIAPPLVNEEFILGVYAFDQSGNIGKISNLLNI